MRLSNEEARRLAYRMQDLVRKIHRSENTNGLYAQLEKATDAYEKEIDALPEEGRQQDVHGDLVPWACC